MNGQPPPRRHDEKAKAVLVRQAGKMIEYRCHATNEQVDAGMLPAEQRLDAEQIALQVKHTEERAALEVDKNNEQCDLEKKYEGLFAEMQARQQAARLALLSRVEEEHPEQPRVR
jgi:hypothetical protein